MENEKTVIKTSQILADLQAGLTRAEIKAKYAFTHAQMKQIFSLETLKNRRTSVEKGNPFVLEDDLATPPPVNPPAEEAAPVNQAGNDLEEAILERERANTEFSL